MWRLNLLLYAPLVHSDYTGRERAADQATLQQELHISLWYSLHWHWLASQADCQNNKAKISQTWLRSSKKAIRSVGDSINLCSMVILSKRDCLTNCLMWGGSLVQCPVIFLRRSTAASWRTLGVLAVRRCWTRAGTTCGSLASLFICSSACLRASLSGIKNWINSNSSDCAILTLKKVAPAGNRLGLCEFRESSKKWRGSLRIGGRMKTSENRKGKTWGGGGCCCCCCCSSEGFLPLAMGVLLCLEDLRVRVGYFYILTSFFLIF